MFKCLNCDDVTFVKRALSYYAQVYFESGVFVDENGCVGIKENHHAVVKRCDEIIDKLNNDYEEAPIMSFDDLTKHSN